MAFSKKIQKKIEEKDDRIKKLEDELQDLTMKYKYCLFDVEATRRERDHYRNLLNENLDKE